MVSRIAQAWAYGPKYRVPRRRLPRPTNTRGNSSDQVTATHGYDLSSRYLMLNRGSNCLIQVYSSWSDSSSFWTTVHSTFAAARTIVWVRKCRPAGSAK